MDKEIEGNLPAETGAFVIRPHHGIVVSSVASCGARDVSMPMLGLSTHLMSSQLHSPH